MALVTMVMGDSAVVPLFGFLMLMMMVAMLRFVIYGLALLLVVPSIDMLVCAVARGCNDGIGWRGWC